MINMDEIDQRLLQLLRRDARASISDLAGHLGLTRATVRARMDKLHQSGEVLGYTAILKTDHADQPVRGITMIEVSGGRGDRVVKALDRMAEITAIHTTNGRWDLVVEFGTDSLETLEAVLRQIRLIDGIMNSETSLYLTTKRSQRAQTAR